MPNARAMIFLCEHETQGIAYQQALSCGVPILAWDRGGHWQDPACFPPWSMGNPVTSVPYWDERCGRTFAAPQNSTPRVGIFGTSWSQPGTAREAISWKT